VFLNVPVLFLFCRTSVEVCLMCQFPFTVTALISSADVKMSGMVQPWELLGAFILFSFCFSIFFLFCLLSKPEKLVKKRDKGWHYTNSMELSSREIASCAAIQEPPNIYGNRRFITMFTRAHHRSLSLARSVQSTPPQTIRLRSILIIIFPPKSGSC
jgi:hypothetical protein